jgi:hypothetical protein
MPCLPVTDMDVDFCDETIIFYASALRHGILALWPRKFRPAPGGLNHNMSEMARISQSSNQAVFS